MPLYTNPMRLSTALREAGLYRVFSVMLNETEDGDIGPYAALHWYASDHHGGQTCPLYAILSQSQYTPGAMERECPEEFRHLYNMLEDAANK
jgi:hypothetical protein